MKVSAEFATNTEEIDYAERVGLPLPEPDIVYQDLHFKLEDVRRMWMLRSGNMMILFYDGDSWIIKFDQEIYDKIAKHLE